MDNAKFKKLCKGLFDALFDFFSFEIICLNSLVSDTGLLGGHLTSADCDLIFTRVKPHNDRKITYPLFQNAIKEIAAKKYPGDPAGEQKVIDTVLKAGGPGSSGTVAGITIALSCFV